MKTVVYRSIVGALILATGTATMRAVAEESLPENLRGFSGQVRGVVVEKGERNTFAFKVARVVRVWRDNKATNPEALAGRTVPVGPRWAKGDDGKWHPVEPHVAFIRQLEAGQEITLEIQNVERSHFCILELSTDQRQISGRREAVSDRHANRQNNERSDRQGERHAERRSDRRTDEATAKRAERRTERRTDRRDNERSNVQTDRRTDRQTVRQNEERTERQNNERTEAEMRELRQEVRRLRAEVDELRRLLREKKD